MSKTLSLSSSSHVSRFTSPVSRFTFHVSPLPFHGVIPQFAIERSLSHCFQGAPSPRFPDSPFHASRFTSHASRLTLHVSRVTFHVSRFTSHLSRSTESVPNSQFGLRISQSSAHSLTVFKALRLPVSPIPRFTSHVSRFTLHASRFTSPVSRFTFHVSPLPFHGVISNFAIRISQSSAHSLTLSL